jgi:hypothetical protein
MGPTQLGAQRRLGLPPAHRAAAASLTPSRREHTNAIYHHLRRPCTARSRTRRRRFVPPISGRSKHHHHDSDGLPPETPLALPHTHHTPTPPPRARAPEYRHLTLPHHTRALRRRLTLTRARAVTDPAVELAQRRRWTVHRPRAALRTTLGALCASTRGSPRAHPRRGRVHGLGKGQERAGDGCNGGGIREGGGEWPDACEC